MTVIAPRTLVEAPPILPLAHGLFSAVADFRGGRFETGVEWEHRGGTDIIDGFSAIEADYGDMVGIPKDVGGYSVPADTDALPFSVYAEWLGSPISFSPADAQAKANERLAKWEQTRVEQAFWTGDLKNTPNLKGANGSVAPTVLTALKATFGGAMGALEDWLGSISQGGVIHMTRGLAMIGLDDGVLEVKNGRLQTELGTQVVAGAGYPGTAPQGNGSVATTWAYATPAIIGYRSEAFGPSDRDGDLLTRSTNDLHAIAERTYLLAFDQVGVGAVEVTL